MPAPTNPRKKALMPAGPLRKKLRAAGHHLSPVVQVGKDGVTDAVIRQLDEALAHHELVKVKVGTESPEDRFEAAERLGEGTSSQLAQILGRTALLYRRDPDEPRYEPEQRPKAAPAAARPAAKRGKPGAAAKPKGKRPAASRASRRPPPRSRRER